MKSNISTFSDVKLYHFSTVLFARARDTVKELEGSRDTVRELEGIT